MSSYALLNLVYRDALFPRSPYRQTWEHLIATGDAHLACTTMVGLLALAHDRACEGDLAVLLREQLDQGRLPDLAALRVRSTPPPSPLPHVVVDLTAIASYDVLLPSLGAAS